MTPTIHSPAKTDAHDLRRLARQANERLAGASAQEILGWAFDQFGTGLVVSSSLADTVMIHLAEQIAPGIDVIFLDTGYHFVETIGTKEAVEAIHRVNMITVRPTYTPVEQDARYGKDLFQTDPDRCCQMRKVEPLDHALKPYQAWATGLRRAEGPARAKTPVIGYDLRRNVVKIAPIATWSDQDVANYISANHLIVNPLLEDGYTSIGCEPCTQRATSDDPRSGRWAGLGKTECGIHL